MTNYRFEFSIDRYHTILIVPAKTKAQAENIAFRQFISAMVSEGLATAKCTGTMADEEIEQMMQGA